MEDVLICTHRLQPLHLGHVRFWREIRARFTAHLLICILRNDLPENVDPEAEVTNFSSLSSAAFAAGRMPLPNWERLRLTQLAVDSDPTLRNSTTVILRHRADISWQNSIQDLPRQRTWIFNLTSEAAFDNAKLAFYRARGEHTVTIPVGRTEGLSGQSIRAALKNNSEDYSFLPIGCREYFRLHCQTFFRPI